MYFNQDGVISSLNGKPLELVDHTSVAISYLLKTVLNGVIQNVWTAIDWLTTILKSDLFDKMKWDFFPSCTHVSTIA